jgi:hypothetical protein
MIHEFFCIEPNIGGVKRVARPLEIAPGPVLEVWRKMCKWNTSLDERAIGEFYDTNKLYYLIDEIGLAWATFHNNSVEGHFVFWDGRLRGREPIIKGMADFAMDVARVDRLWVMVPKKERMILRFLWRCGFEVDGEQDGLVRVSIQHSRRK